MTIEQRILNIAEGPLNFPDCRELRAIAFEVRKQEDRIKQLEEALDLVIPNCSWVHHSKKHQHKCGEPCPVVALIEKSKEDKL